MTSYTNMDNMEEIMDSEEDFDINSYIEVNIDQTNTDTIVKNEIEHPAYSDFEGKIPIIKTEIDEEQHVENDAEEPLKFFQCNRCDYKTKRRYEMKNHIAANHFGVRFKCDQCDYEGKRKDKLNAHKKRIHEGIKSVKKKSSEIYPCDKCDYVSKRRYELRIHIESNHEGLRHYCTQCPYNAKRKDKLTHHMKTKHSNKSNESENCVMNFVDVNPKQNVEEDNVIKNTTSLDSSELQIKKEIDVEVKATCGEPESSDLLDFVKVVIQNGQTNIERAEESNRKINFDNFYDEIPGLEPFFNCKECPYSSKNKSSLYSHIKAIHSGETYPCEDCDYVATYKSGLKSHILNMHNKEKRYFCQHCSYKTNSKGQLDSHVKAVHEGLLRFACEFPGCDFRSTWKSNLKTHVKSVHLKDVNEYPCPSCDYKPTNEHNLKQHILSIHDRVHHFCHICNYKSRWKSNLISHIKTIHEGLRFKCPECEYECNRSVNLDNHIKAIHEGVSYSCKLCPFRSAWRNKAREHVKRVHGQNTDFSMSEFITETYTKRFQSYVNENDETEDSFDPFIEEPAFQHVEIKQELDISEDIETIL